MAKAHKKAETASLPMEVEAPERPRTLSLDFPRGKRPDGFDELTIGGDQTVTVTGKITRLTQEKGWGASLAMDISKVTLK